MSVTLPYIPAPVGLPIARQPYHFKNAKMAIFMLDGDAGRLNALLEQQLNQPSQGQYDFRCLQADDKVKLVMILAQADALASSPDGVVYGQERYSELSFWLPCYDRAALRRGEFRPSMFLPFLFPDSFTAVTTGREMFGFAKQAANFRYPGGQLDPRHPAFCASTSAFKTLGSDSMAQVYDFIKLEDGNGDAAPLSWADAAAVGGALAAEFLGRQWRCGESGEVLGNIANDFLADCPAVFLKQFPAVENAQDAQSRCLTETTFSLDAFRGGAPWLRQHTLQFAQLASHPVVATLGLHTSGGGNGFDNVRAAGFWVDVDFSLDTGRTLAAIPPRKQKIAVLGGGIGSLAAVYGITQDPDWQQKYDITLYQMGWRLGGKGASGRNRDIGDRIEEHGLHIWLGYYDNAFKLIQNCYAALNRPANTPLASWDMAFKPHSTIVLEEYFGERWHHWPLQFRPNNEVPGQGEVKDDHPMRFFGHLRELLENLHGELHQHLQHSGTVRKAVSQHLVAKAPDWLDRVIERVAEPVGAALEREAEEALAALFGRLQGHIDIFPQHGEGIARLAANLGELDSGHWLNVIAELRDLMEQMLQPFAEVIDTVRRMLTMLDIGLAVAKGVIEDGVLWHGYRAINHYDFSQWLEKHGASHAAANSAPIRAFYDLCLAFPNGQNEIVGDGVGIGGNVSAGELLHSYILVALCYKGAVMWKMQAGMGDVVMTPIYQVLRQRGVKFEFFHKVTDLKLTGDGKSIAAIDIDVQATLKPGLAEYNPLYDVKGLACWPSDPLYAQLVQGQELKALDIDLESSWSPWQAVAKKTLQQGTDFDQVVLGISVAALPYISSELAAANPGWKAMLDNSNTSQCQAMQLWLNRTLEETGWASASPVLDAYAEPFNTWAAMDQTLDKETWPQNALPFSIAYFCNNLKQVDPIPPFSDHDYPAREKRRVMEMGRQWLQRYAGHLWPYAAQADGQALDWNVLVDIDNREGEARLAGQYFRANVEPTERYVCNAAGTNQYRLRAGDTGFANLYIAGDWIDNGSLNLGCVESTVISGLQAAEALTGYDLDIVRGYRPSQREQ